MSCSHRKAIPLVGGVFFRSSTDIIRKHDVNVYVCPSCGAIRLDESNVFCYRKGRWSEKNRVNKDLMGRIKNAKTNS